jgi:anthranilate synthase component II
VHLPRKMRILLIDNYDSFTWNLHHLIVDAGASAIDIIENDKVTPEMVEKADALVFSPGPGLPGEAGLMKSIIKGYAGRKKMLGICLGHQAIAEVFGASLLHADEIFHGTATQLVILEQDYIFCDMPGLIEAGRYHSWVVNPLSVPQELLVTAVDQAGVIMAIRHKTLDITGMQFHPESIMTPLGEKMIRNWITG